jgi:hypothetical protein
LRLRSVKPSKSQRSRSRFLWRNAQKQPMQNIVAKKRARREDVDSDYLFANIFLPTFFMQSVSMALDRRRIYYDVGATDLREVS